MAESRRDKELLRIYLRISSALSPLLIRIVSGFDPLCLRFCSAFVPIDLARKWAYSGDASLGWQ